MKLRNEVTVKVVIDTEGMAEKLREWSSAGITPQNKGGRVEQKPTVGLIVHYRSYGTPNGEYEPEVRAAIITAIHKGDNSMQVSLCVLNPTGMFFNEKVNYSVSTPGCWSWPPRD